MKKFVVGALTQGVAVLVTEDHQVVEFPASLLPAEVYVGCVIDVQATINPEHQRQRLATLHAVFAQIEAEASSEHPTAQQKSFVSFQPLSQQQIYEQHQQQKLLALAQSRQHSADDSSSTTENNANLSLPTIRESEDHHRRRRRHRRSGDSHRSSTSSSSHRHHRSSRSHRPHSSARDSGPDRSNSPSSSSPRALSELSSRASPFSGMEMERASSEPASRSSLDVPKDAQPSHSRRHSERRSTKARSRDDGDGDKERSTSSSDDARYDDCERKTRRRDRLDSRGSSVREVPTAAAQSRAEWDDRISSIASETSTSAVSLHSAFGFREREDSEYVSVADDPSITFATMADPTDVDDVYVYSDTPVHHSAAAAVHSATYS